VGFGRRTGSASRGNAAIRISGDTVQRFTRLDGLPGPSQIRFGGEDREGNLWLHSERRLLRYRQGAFTAEAAA